jgi:hypothetical protein
MARRANLGALMIFCLPLHLAWAADSAERDDEMLTHIELPIEATDWSVKRFVSLLNPSHPGNRIGYRFHEHVPSFYGEIPAESADAPPDAAAIEEAYASKPGVYKKIYEVTEEEWAPQTWTFYFVPAVDGCELLWVVDTKDAGLNEYYTAQECFRMSGETNKGWRKRIAFSPAFSEYDHWAAQDLEQQDKTSVSFVRRDGAWQAIPPVKMHIICRTPLGLAMDNALTGGDLPETDESEPYGPSRFEPPIDSGLATRSTAEDSWVCALYWEGTTHITDHHPADCLHAFVNLGPLGPHSKRAIRGRIYWMQASKDELFERWKRDFGEQRLDEPN